MARQYEHETEVTVYLPNDTEEEWTFYYSATPGAATTFHDPGGGGELEIFGATREGQKKRMNEDEILKLLGKGEMKRVEDRIYANFMDSLSDAYDRDDDDRDDDDFDY